MLKKLTSPLARDLYLKISAFNLFHAINNKEPGTLQRTWNVSALGTALTSCQHQNYPVWDANESISSGNKILLLIMQIGDSNIKYSKKLGFLLNHVCALMQFQLSKQVLDVNKKDKATNESN